MAAIQTSWPNTLDEIFDELKTAKDEADAWSSVPRLRDLADLLAPILKQPSPVLQSRLDEVWESVRLSGQPHKSVFAIRRHGPPKQRRLWWPQLMLVIAQAHSRRVYRLVPVAVCPQAATALRINAKKSWKAFEANYRGRNAIEQVLDATKALRRLVPRGLQLKDGFLWRDGLKISKQLTPLEQKFLHLLLAASGKRVSYAQFQTSNVSHPEKTKSLLVRKNEFGFLRSLISSDSGGYKLRP